MLLCVFLTSETLGVVVVVVVFVVVVVVVVVVGSLVQGSLVHAAHELPVVSTVGRAAPNHVLRRM
jgi:hypothetical protein